MIRAAVPADAEAIDRIHVHAWRRAYADFIPPDRMPDVEDEEPERLARWRERLADEEIATWVHEVDGLVAGFAAAGPQVLWALYVDPVAQGAGVGSALLAHAEGHLRGEAILWVYTANEAARRFYEARGWELVPGSEETGDHPAPGVKYRKAL